GFNGSFDEFRVYNYTLSESEIRGNTLAGPDTLTSTATAVYSWKPAAAGTFAFNSASNWTDSSSFPDGSGAVANLVTNLTGDQTVELNTTATVGSLTLGDLDGSNKFKIAPGSAGILELSAAAGIAATLTQSPTSAANEISAPVRLLSNVEVTNTSSTAALTFSAGLLGSAEFAKAGSGQVNLVADNSSFGGSFTVHSGVLSIGDGGTTGTPGDAPVNVTDEGVLALNRSDATTLHTPITGAGLVRVLGAGQVTNTGVINSTGTVYVSPGSSLVNAATTMTTGFANIEGQLAAGPDTSFVTGDLNVGNLETGFSSLILSGGTVDAAAIYVAKNPGTSGVIAQTGGVLNDRTGGGDCVIGGVPANASEVWGALRMTGGVLNTTSHFQIGGQGVGVMEVENATVNFNGGYPSIARYVNGTTSRGRGIMDVRSGGVVNQTAANTRLNVGEKGNGALNVRDGGVVDLTGGMMMIATATDQGQSDVNLLTGGTIASTLIYQNSTLGGEQGRFNFNGGTLKPKVSRDDFMQNIDRAYIYPGGAVIDSNGFNVGIHQGFQDPAGLGVASIPVVNGGSGYLAPPYLEILGDGRGATAMATLKDGKISGIVITNPGTGYTTAPTVNIVGGGAGSGLALGAPVLALNHAGSFRKTGAGSVALYNFSDFTGSATVEAGDLLVNGSFLAFGSQMTVKAGATLGGYGQIGGTLAVDGTVDAGTREETFVSDLLTIGGDVTFRSGSTLKVDIDDNYFPVNDCLEIAGQLNITGAALKINALATGANLPYTIARCGHLTGTFASIPAGVAVRYNADSIEITAIANPYQSWIGGFFPGTSDQAIVGPNADPDGDGYSNAVEFALGGSPKNAADRPKTYSMIADSGDAGATKELLLTIPVPANAPAFSAGATPSTSLGGFSISVEGSLDLANFDSPVSAVPPLTSGLPTAPDGYVYRTFRLDASDGLPGKGFMRVNVTQEP
ncbi:MAG: hypothetical protein JWO82_3531, partial [Akkermansiaceae bacterium]|nr:hypothetical protein [Akkermansiaceae bacterium]